MANSDTAKPATAEVSQRQFQFLFAPNLDGGLRPMSANAISSTLANIEGVRIVDQIKAPNLDVMASDHEPVAGDVVVAEMCWERAMELNATSTRQIIMERNWELRHLGYFAPNFAGAAGATLVSAAPTIKLTIKVQGDGGRPIARAQVIAYGHGFPVQGETDADGKVVLAIYASSLIGVEAIYVKPFADFWEKFISHPALFPDSDNIITLEPLSAFPESQFPGNPFIGWGERLMGLDRDTMQQYSGKGARVAIIDSGCDNSHPVLTHVSTGLDLTDPKLDGAGAARNWQVDTLSHGTHCAGIITGNGVSGLRGFAPEAEVHILKLFPGGRFDVLIRALKYCIDNQIDVVNCSLGSDQGSELVRLWMEKARQAGVAVVVAAGNSAGPVQFPALLPNVLSVSAIGKAGNFPGDTYHRQTEPSVLPGLVGPNGIFAPKFSCFGPEIKLCAPGVAVISSVPGGGYAAWDGTSMAAPHITGLLTLIAAHHPAIATMPRDAARVDRMLQILTDSASSVGLDRMHGGAGIPAIGSSFSGTPRAGQNGVSPNIDAIVSAVLSQLQRLGVNPGINAAPHV